MKKLLYSCLIIFVVQSHASEAPKVPQKATAAELLNMTDGDIKRLTIEKNTLLSCRINGMPKRVYYMFGPDMKYNCIGNRAMVTAVFQKGNESD